MKERQLSGSCATQGMEKRWIWNSGTNWLNESDRFEGIQLLKLISPKKLDEREWVGFTWLTVRTCGWPLRTVSKKFLVPCTMGICFY